MITKADIGPERNSIVQGMALSHSSNRVVDFLTDTTRLLNRWGEDYGFSIGLSSCLVTTPEIEQVVKEQTAKAELMISAMGGAPDDPTELDKYEEQILAYVGAPGDVYAKTLQKNLPANNPLNIATLSGAKGKVTNLTHIAVALGQQHLSGGRIKSQMTYDTRCLPWFRPGDESIESHGYCASSYLQGLSLPEMYFHMMVGREGLMGTAVETAETGFMHRKAVKTLQDIQSKYDGSIRNIDNTLFEFVYGDDGFAPERLQEVETKNGKFLSFFNAKTISQQINRRYGATQE